MKFLVLRFSSIGDIVLTTPVLRCLKKQVPGAEIHYACKKGYSSLVTNNPYVDKLHPLGNSLDELIRQLRTEEFDYVIDLHHNLRTLKIKRALQKPSFSFRKLNVEKWMLTALKVDRLPRIHIVDRYLATVRSFGVKDDGAGLDFFIPEDQRIRESDLPMAQQAGFIAVVIGAALATKKMPVERLTELCRRIDHPLVLLGGPEDREEGEEIARMDPLRIYNACGKFSLEESADLVRRARLLISHDTGLMHIAAALKKPVISIWGNTVPAFGMYPYYGDNFLRASGQQLPYDIMEVSGLRCRPCSKIGYRACPKGHFRCMRDLSIDAIVEAVEARLKNLR